MVYAVRVLLVFGPLGAFLLHYVSLEFSFILGLLWSFTAAEVCAMLRPRWSPSLLAWAVGYLGGLAFVMAVVSLPPLAGLVLALLWVPVAVVAHFRGMQRKALTQAWRMTKVEAFAELVEAGIADKEAATRVNTEFGDYPRLPMNPPEAHRWAALEQAAQLRYQRAGNT